VNISGRQHRDFEVQLVVGCKRMILPGVGVDTEARATNPNTP
jgi:hypothetical protein